ncbi:hypothetical protein [Tellurirhabdus bombi]|uniref:hypothetical protein n=1 Tax=Tellurirhabdus bombi TaxID=2907205 RepID=UPI001F26DB9C|nr:hypothetical protein [Tellurirhabdus bombi]
MTPEALQPGTTYFYVDGLHITPVGYVGRSHLKPKLFRFENQDARTVTIDEMSLRRVFDSELEARMCLRELLTDEHNQNETKITYLTELQTDEKQAFKGTRRSDEPCSDNDKQSNQKDNVSA